MLTIKGKYNSANIMIDELDQETISQIYSFLNHPAFAHTYIAIMSDCHKGAGAVIGYTAKMNNYIIPEVVGVDIGCGVNAYPLTGIKSIDFTVLDNFIKRYIPSGFSIHSNDKIAAKSYDDSSNFARLSEVVNYTNQDMTKVLKAVGTLGGGNHFIEVDQTDSGDYWLLIHSGSRNFGLKAATFYQNKAKDLMKSMFVGADAYRGLEYLPLDNSVVKLGQDYLRDMQVAQEYASKNRRAMGEIILNSLFPSVSCSGIESVHNYINFEDNIIRKGAISAHEGEKLVIPFNMRDGSIIATGKGNSKWNYSAPHGAGRVMSRRKAKESITVADFENEMKGIFTTTANQSTIDEAPMAYKDKSLIVDAIGETVNIEFFMKPVYNYKSSGN